MKRPPGGRRIYAALSKAAARAPSLFSTPGGAFLNLEHRGSPTASRHEHYLQALGVAPADEDPSNKLLDVHTQLRWFRTIGFADVDCHWKWRELALLAGVKPR